VGTGGDRRGSGFETASERLTRSAGAPWSPGLQQLCCTFFATAALFSPKVLSLSGSPVTVGMSSWATIRCCTRSLAAFSIPTAWAKDTVPSLQQFATLVQHLATLEGPKTDSEADLTISGEFLKPTKSVWSEMLACLS